MNFQNNVDWRNCMELGFVSEILKEAITIVKDVLEAVDPSDVIAVIGAAAWIPAIVQIIYSVREKNETKNRTISIQLMDTKFFNKVSIYKSSNPADSSKSGSVILLATNIFIPEKSFFVDSYLIKLKMKNIENFIIAKNIGNVGIVKDNKHINDITTHIKYNFNLHREIICEKDNIRVFAIFIEENDTVTEENIENIEFEFKGTEDTKLVFIDKESISSYVKCDFLSTESCYRYVD